MRMGHASFLWCSSVALLSAAVAACTAGGNAPSSLAEQSTGGAAASCGFTAGGSASTLKVPAPTMTTAEWEAATAPLATVHLVLGALCDDGPISQEYQLLPGVSCMPTSDFDGETNPVLWCSAHVGCVGPSDCQDGSFGTCVGFRASYCTYPAIPMSASCLVDSDCSALPSGRCMPGESCQVFFYPDGELGLPGPHCIYAEQPCTANSDCSSAPQGNCTKVIRYAQCTYNECLVDGDCPSGSRCYCYDHIAPKRCIPADCNSDTDCGAGQVCRLEQTNCGIPVAYHCPTSADTCAKNQDCAYYSCRFISAQWQCTEQLCLTD